MKHGIMMILNATVEEYNSKRDEFNTNSSTSNVKTT